MLVQRLRSLPDHARLIEEWPDFTPDSATRGSAHPPAPGDKKGKRSLRQLPADPDRYLPAGRLCESARSKGGF
jgi:hypothetical protein